MIQRVGSFDREFFAYCEDLDLSIRARRRAVRAASLVYHDVVDTPRRAELRIYYSTRNLMEVVRRRAPWYAWFSCAANFLARWVAFFVALTIVRRQPRYLAALVRGMVGFARRRMGPNP